MTTLSDDVKDKIRRSISHEFVRMEDDFDNSRNIRKTITDKIMSDIEKISLVDQNGKVSEDAEIGIKLYNTALKAISDSEKASSQAIALKLKNQEQEMLSSASANDRIAIILRATAPGAIPDEFPTEDLENKLVEMFDNDIKDYEMKTSPRDLEE